ncbi:MAG: membrane protein, partial [Methanocorpusculum sp.]|nr:membrane protein [Methanocorpusculum sp.]
MLSRPARGAVFTLGLYCMGLGVALAVISNLGTSPISCLPYVVSMVVSCSIGTMTFGLNIIFLLLQIAILKRRFRPYQILQIPGVFLFSAFIDLNVFLISPFAPGNYAAQFAVMLAGCVMLALGIAL